MEYPDLPAFGYAQGIVQRTLRIDEISHRGAYAPGNEDKYQANNENN